MSGVRRMRCSRGKGSGSHDLWCFCENALSEEAVRSL